MARILLTWELGSGFGHVASLSSIAGALRCRGHTVVAALRDPTRGESFFAPLGVRCLASPLPLPGQRASLPIATYADLLSSVGFGSVESLQATVAGWERIFTEADPDAVVFDHSPFALLAAMGYKFGKLQHGTGFYIPPDTTPLPALRPWLLKDPQEANEREAVVLSVINQNLERRGQQSLSRLAELYGSTEQWLATYEELDHLGPRGAGSQPAKNSAPSRLEACLTYRGITPPQPNGVQPAWPMAQGPRIFAYLQPDATSLSIVKVLARLGYPTIVRIANANPPQELAGSKSIHWVTQAVDVPEIVQQCDLAVLSGGHGTLAAVLLAGKPVLIAPIQFEQLLLAQVCEKLGLGAAIPPSQVDSLANGIDKLLTGQSNHGAVATFAKRYRSIDLQQQLDSLVCHIEQLAAHR